MRLKNRIKFFKHYFLKRSASYIVDIVTIKFIIQLLYIALFTAANKLIGIRVTLDLEDWEIVSKIIFMTTYLGYFGICLLIYDGQTLGLSIFKLKTKQTGFNKRGIKTSSLLNRVFASYISYEFYCLPLVYCIIDKNNCSVADYVSRTEIMYFSSDNSSNALKEDNSLFRNTA